MATNLSGLTEVAVSVEVWMCVRERERESEQASEREGGRRKYNVCAQQSAVMTWCQVIE